MPAGPGVKINPALLASGDGRLHPQGRRRGAGIYYTSGKRGPKGNVRNAAWSPDGSRVVFHKRQTAPPTAWRAIWSRNPGYELTLTGILPSFSPSGDRFVMIGRPRRQRLRRQHRRGRDRQRTRQTVIYQDKTRNVLGPQWSPSGDTIIFGIGVFNAFFNGFHGLFLKPERSRRGRRADRDDQSRTAAGSAR